ncbi:hypothetical protein BDM02DRAFT_3114551 [Thelephora ganbajun]|uniref:Uncharacterized protein n=1 Tax=Thelephora ganbajun TaxID=370292 RepID=A0ACB6ZI06_THEGA|nr:hypothetical protein BDM02DRAFT_3114551 [Thelephora ganbajun]
MSAYPGQGLSTDELLFALGKDLERKLARPYPPFDFAEVDTLEKSLSKIFMRIRTMRNALVPVNRLPIEILRQIPWWLPYVCNIIAASHVCRYWRAAFLSYSDLWTYLDCRSTRATRAFVERSGVAPLHICIRPGYSFEAFVYTIPHMRRWESLDVMVLRDEIGPVLATLLGPGEAPKLHNLSVIPMVGQGSENMVTSKGKILGGVIPSLQRLSLCNIEVDINKLTTPNLTYLLLACTRSEFVNMTALLNFLERSPLLEDFELRYPGPNVSDMAHLGRVVSLNHLRRIVLWDRSSLFLDHLVLPYGIECEFNFLFTDVSATTGFFEEMFGGPPERLKQIFEAESLSIVPHDSHGSVRFLGPSGLVEIFPSFSHAERTSMTRFITYSPSVLNMVKFLFVGSRNGVIPEWKSADVRKHLDKMTSLESLTIMHCNSTSFIQALLPAEGKVPCPTLKNLTIYTGPFENFSIPAFRSMVEQRGSHGHKFRKMVLVFSYEHCVHPAIPNLEVKVDDRALYWDSKKRIWRYLNEGEVYWDGDRTLAPPGIIPMNPLMPPVNLHV